MSDKKDLAIRRAQQAQNLLDDELLRIALDALHKDAIAAMLVAQASDLLDRRADVLAVEKLERKLRTYIANGKIAEQT